ncbi:unnamed protein product, partial [Iphiclides podalirius]
MAATGRSNSNSTRSSPVVNQGSNLEMELAAKEKEFHSGKALRRRSDTGVSPFYALPLFTFDHAATSNKTTPPNRSQSKRKQIRNVDKRSNQMPHQTQPIISTEIGPHDNLITKNAPWPPTGDIVPYRLGNKASGRCGAAGNYGRNTRADMKANVKLTYLLSKY